MEDGMFYAKAAAYLGAAFAIGIGALGGALGMGMIGTKACEMIGKFPDNYKIIRTAMFLAMGIVETCVLYCALLAGALLFYNI